MTRYRKLFPNEKLGTGMEEKGSMMNRTIKAAVGMVAIAAMSVGTLAACGGSSSSSDNGKGKVYFLNFKPESSDEWKKLAKDYTKETGVEVKVQTAASGTYEQTLKSEIAKSEAPTLFQVNGPVGYQNWSSYTEDMSDTEPYKQLINKDVALKDGDKVVGVPYAMETYGLIYNKDLLAKYIATDGAKIKSVDDIDNFDTLKAVADDIQAKKDQLGVKGAFTSAGFDSSSDWRSKTHLANLPLYYEFKDDNVTKQPETIKGTYLPEYKNNFDLYLKNSSTEPTSFTGTFGLPRNSTGASPWRPSRSAAETAVRSLPMGVMKPSPVTTGRRAAGRTAFTRWEAVRAGGARRNRRARLRYAARGYPRY